MESSIHNIILPAPVSKSCSKCKITKPLSDFNNYKKSKDGKYCQCRICHNNYFYQRITVPRLKYFNKFSEDRKKYIKTNDPNNYSYYKNKLGSYRKYPLPLKYFECYLLFNKEDKLVDKRHPNNIELITKYNKWINSDEYVNFVSSQ